MKKQGNVSDIARVFCVAARGTTTTTTTSALPTATTTIPETATTTTVFVAPAPLKSRNPVVYEQPERATESSGRFPGSGINTLPDSLFKQVQQVAFAKVAPVFYSLFF